MAACRQARKQGIQPHVDIMLPLISSASEVSILRERLEPIVTEDARQSIGIGAMIETPRACLRAEEIAQGCDFFSFGTNDLTQWPLACHGMTRARLCRNTAIWVCWHQTPFGFSMSKAWASCWPSPSSEAGSPSGYADGIVWGAGGGAVFGDAGP